MKISLEKKNKNNQTYFSYHIPVRRVGRPHGVLAQERGARVGRQVDGEVHLARCNHVLEDLAPGQRRPHQRREQPVQQPAQNIGQRKEAY